MCLVAALQMTTAAFTHLTPWKGGGFGMFSTINSPWMRTVTIEAETESGERVLIYARQALQSLDKKLYERIRNFPSAQSLERAGKRLLESDFVLSSVTSEAKYFSDLVDQNLPEQATALRELYDRPLFQTIAPQDAGSAPYRVARMQNLRLRVWQCGFDAERLLYECTTKIDRTLTK